MGTGRRSGRDGCARALGLATAALAAVLAAAELGAQPLLCNGHAHLCERSFDQVAYLTTHNAYANAADGYTVPLPNQELDMPTQLADGVRALMLDTHDQGGEPYLCHGVCGFFGQRPLVDGLVEIRQFLDTHPNEVVTIILEAYVTEAATEAAFVEAGLLDYALPHAPGEPWPTLGEMIASGQRLVVLTDDSAASLPWHVYVWDVAWETPFSYSDVSEFTCTENRGTPPNDLFILNHFVTGLLGAVRWDAPVINDYALLHDRAAECWGFAATNPERHVPNFVTVDHYDLGEARDVVAAINAEWPEPPLWHSHGGPLTRGTDVELTALGAVPGTLVRFVLGTGGQGLGPCPAPLGGACLDLLQPRLLLGEATADATGTATFTLAVPGDAPLGEVSTEAVVLGTGGTPAHTSIAVTAPVVDGDSM